MDGGCDRDQPVVRRVALERFRTAEGRRRALTLSLILIIVVLLIWFASGFESTDGDAGERVREPPLRPPESELIRSRQLGIAQVPRAARPSFAS